jgi:hypothetical protein
MIRLTDAGLDAIIGGPVEPAPASVRVEFCLYGEAWGEYIFVCADSVPDLLTRFGRVGDGTNRVIRTTGEPWHRHDGSGECIPTRVLYGRHTRAAREALARINRAIVAGYPVVHI